MFFKIQLWLRTSQNKTVFCFERFQQPAASRPPQDSNQPTPTHSDNVDQVDIRAGDGGLDGINLVRKMGDGISASSSFLLSLGQTPLLIEMGPALRERGNGGTAMCFGYRSSK